MRLLCQPFHVGEYVVYFDPERGTPMRGEVVRTLIASCVVYFRATGASLVLASSLLRRCPMRLAYCRPRMAAPAPTPRGAA